MSVINQIICRIDEYNVRNYRGWFLGLVSVVVLYGSMAILSFILLLFEQSSEASNIKSYGDAFWALQMSASTIGFGDFYPVTIGGRIVVTMMFYIGVGLVGFIGALVADRIVGFSNTGVKNRELRKQNAEILELVKELKQSVSDLESEKQDASRNMRKKE